MCGIVGVFDVGQNYSKETLNLLAVAMRDSMAHRGPDDKGIWSDPEAGCALGHRRLSVIDLRPEGRQPMTASGVDTVVTYNGEIYNFQKIRTLLAQRGRHFSSLSDTEILPFLFEDLDEAALAQLNGMFAFGAWHTKRRELLLARDGFGKKPLYVYEDEGIFAFASEIQAFYALPSFKEDIDHDGLAEYFLLGYLPGPRSIYRHIRQIPAGSFERFSFENGVKTLATGRFFDFNAPSRAGMAGADKEHLKRRLKGQLIEAVEQRMIGDVPIGAFLSGGVDSSLVVAIVRRELGKEISTFSMGFDKSDASEHHAAREIAAYLGTDHHDEMIGLDGVTFIHQLASMLDQPIGDSSCFPTYHLCELARRYVTVCLSGDGGDELFGGYDRYLYMMKKLSNLVSSGKDPATMDFATLYTSLGWYIRTPSQTATLLGGLPPGTAARIEEWHATLNDIATPAIHKMRNIDANLYLPGSVLAKVDRMSMQHALEVRCPLLDPALAQTALGLAEDDCWVPPATTKRLLREIASDYLPAEWMNRPKKGFGLPTKSWGKAELIQLGHELFSDGSSRLADLTDPDALQAAVSYQSRDDIFSAYRMWPLIILELWLRAQTSKIAEARRESNALCPAIV